MAFFSATKCIIENSDGELLMVKESKDHIHRKWDFPGGGFEEGESVIECAKREALEETGYEVDIENLLSVYKGDSNDSNTETIVFVFTASIINKQTEELEDDVIETRFFEPEEIRELELREDNRIDIIEKYQSGDTYSLNLLRDDLNLLN